METTGSPRTEDRREANRGRPVQMDPRAREARILEATEVILAERGLDATAMAAIAREAGMSKRTVYGLFGSRDRLLSTCIGRISQRVFRPIDEGLRPLPVAERLRALLTLNLPTGAEARSIEILRAIISKARAYPALARQAHEDAYGQLVRHIAGELRLACRQGEIALAEETLPEAARMLVDMAFENPLCKLLNPEAARLAPEERARRRDLAIGIFLAGIRQEHADRG